MEAIRPKSSRNNQKIFQKQLVEALSWPRESSRSRLAGSASTSTGRIAAVVEWSSLVERRRKQMAEFSRRKRHKRDSTNRT
jgi:hypothetical protein